MEVSGSYVLSSFSEQSSGDGVKPFRGKWVSLAEPALHEAPSKQESHLLPRREPFMSFMLSMVEESHSSEA